MSGNFSGRIRQGRVGPARGLRLAETLRVGINRVVTPGGFELDRVTFDRPVSLEEMYNLYNALRDRVRGGFQTSVFFTFQFVGTTPGDVQYRTVKSRQFRSFGRFRQVFEDMLNPNNQGSGAVGMDVFGEVYELDRMGFEVLYSRRGTAPRIMAHESGFGTPPVKTLEGHPPLVKTRTQGSMLTKHCFDVVCESLFLPLYSDCVNSPLPPTQAEGLEWMRSVVPSTRPIFVIDPWRVEVGRFELRQVCEDVSNAKTTEAHPDEFLVISGDVFVALKPWYVFKAHDPQRLLYPHGPIVLAIANNHVEHVPVVFDVSIECWIPELRRPGRYFLTRERNLVFLSPRARSAQNNADEGATLSPEWIPLPVGNDADGDPLTVGQIVELAAREREESAPEGKTPSGLKMTQLSTTWKSSLVMSDSCVGKSAVRGKHGTIYYDFETVYNAAGKLMPYSVAYLLLSNEDRDRRLLPETGAVQFTTEELENLAVVHVGPDCGNVFANIVRDLALLNSFETLTLTGFNSAKFDAFLLMEGVDFLDTRGESAPTSELFWKNHFFMGGALVGGSLGARATLHLDNPSKNGMYEVGLSVTEISLMDMARHLTAMSLAGACKSFGIPHQKVGDFDHQVIQAKYEEYAEWDGDMRFIEEWPEFKEKLFHYNKYDVITLAELEASYRQQLYKVTTVVSTGERLPLTAGSLCLKHWKHDLETRVLPRLSDFVVSATADSEYSEFPSEDVCSVFGMWQPLDAKAWTALRTGVVGGRVQLPNGPCEIKETVSSLDVTSLYPTSMVMLKLYFPCGRWTELAPGCEPARWGNLGVYNVDVDQTLQVLAGYPTVVPRKEYSPSGALLRNNWNAPIVNDAWVTTPTLELLREWGAKITYRGGYEWSHKIRNIDLFGALKAFLKGKKRQDELPEGHPDKNKALRSLLKLLANGTYGQTLKGIFERTVTSVTSFQMEKLYQQQEEGKIERINVVQVRGTRVFVDYTRSTESRLKAQGPFIVGAFVLGYSRAYLARMAVRIPPELRLYYDTDSIKTTWTAMLKLKEETADERVPVWPELLEEFPGYATEPLIGGKEVGCWSEEFPPDNRGIIILFKKGYVAVASDGETTAAEGGKPIISLKGVRRNDVLLDPDLRTMLTIMHQQDQADMNDVVRGIYEGGLPVLDNAVVLFRNILSTGVGYVLGSVLNRVASNSKAGAGVKDVDRHSLTFGSIFQTFRVKKLSIHPPQPEAQVCAGKPLDPDRREFGENSWRRYQNWLHRDVPGYGSGDDDDDEETAEECEIHGNDDDGVDDDSDLEDMDRDEVEDERPHTHVDEGRMGDGPGFYSCRR